MDANRVGGDWQVKGFYDFCLVGRKKDKYGDSGFARMTDVRGLASAADGGFHFVEDLVEHVCE